MGFGIGGVETSGSATRDMFIKLDLGEICCGDERWIELAHNRVKWRAVVLNVFNLRVLLPRIYDPPAAGVIAVYQAQVRPNGFSWNGLSSYAINLNTVDSGQWALFVVRVTKL